LTRPQPSGCATSLPRLLSDLDVVDVRRELLAIEPQPHLLVPEPGVDKVLAAFGDAVDLKAPMFHGHSAAVGDLAGATAARLDLSDDQVSVARRGGLVSDLGRAGVPTGTWERPGRFTEDDWAQARLHPYWTEQVVGSSELLREVATAAGAHHERLDGSGYYRRTTAAELSTTARVVAVADAYTTWLEPRPHREPMTGDQAASQLRDEALAGRLDTEVVDAAIGVLEGTNEVRPRQPLPGGLTDRQVDVLRLLAEGLSNREIGRRLGISARTAEHHVQDIYTRLGVSGRAPAALFAMEHHLLGPTGRVN
jgi:HD-GYP domain-containing protein (c-di-GMP phosphodiesterase class II)